MTRTEAEAEEVAETAPLGPALLLRRARSGGVGVGLDIRTFVPSFSHIHDFSLFRSISFKRRGDVQHSYTSDNAHMWHPRGIPQYTMNGLD
jgi:hypothetical protein